ncbi:MAG: type II toxin-antitoxin system HicB family antitoxin [bacterium]
MDPNLIKKEYTVVIEKEADGNLIASVVELPGCHTQAKDMNELFLNIKEVIELYLEVEKPETLLEFVGLQRVAV